MAESARLLLERLALICYRQHVEDQRHPACMPSARRAVATCSYPPSHAQALQGTGFLDAIDQATPDAPVTCFAPSNGAFIVYAATSPGCVAAAPRGLLLRGSAELSA